MRKELLMVPVCLLAVLSVLPAPARAQDYNYAEVRGNVTGIARVTEYNVNTGVSTLKSITLSVRTAAYGDETLSVGCSPGPFTMPRDLCLNTTALLDSYCTDGMVTATSTCIPGPSGICELVRFDGCANNRGGKCVRGWGYLKNVAGAQLLWLDYLLTQNQSACSPKP